MPEAADMLTFLSAANTGAVFVLRSAGACAIALYPIRFCGLRWNVVGLNQRVVAAKL